jgi:hypothetical protein
MSTESLLREILQEIRQVKAHFIPPPVVSHSSPTGPIRNGWAAAEPAKKGPHAGSPRWYKANTEDYRYEFPAVSPLNRPSAVASAGGGENENCPAESFSGPPQLPNATRNARLMGRMTKDEQAALSKEDRMRRCELKKMVSEERKASRSPEEQAKINAKVAKMQAARSATRSSAGGGGSLNRESGLKYGGFRSKIFSEQPTYTQWHGQIGTQASAGGGEAVVASAKNFMSTLASTSPSEREHISSLLGHVKNPKKVVASDLVYNSELECFIDQEGNCYHADLDETRLNPIPDMSKIVGRIRPGVDREQAKESNFIASNARSRKHKNRRNRTRKN